MSGRVPTYKGVADGSRDVAGNTCCQIEPQAPTLVTERIGIGTGRLLTARGFAGEAGDLT